MDGGAGRDGKLAYECPIVFVDWFVALIYIVIMILCRRKRIFIIVACLCREKKKEIVQLSRDTSFLVFFFLFFFLPLVPIRRKTRKHLEEDIF